MHQTIPQDAVLAAFRRIDSNHARLGAINALLGELTPHEWRTLHHITAARSFQYDIIAQLPVELVAIVFAYLDTSAPYRLQRVSRKWCHVLRSPSVLNKSISSWADVQGADYNSCKHKARQLHAFRHGNPNQRFAIESSHGRPFAHSLLVEDTLIWNYQPQSGLKTDTMYVLDMKAWRVQRLHGDGREGIRHVFASDQLVGFTTHGTVCYVWDLDSREKRKFRVPSSNTFMAITCRERTVACAGLLDAHALVYIWHYDNQRGVSFTINYDNPLFTHPPPRFRSKDHEMALLLQPRTRHIIVFVDDLSYPHPTVQDDTDPPGTIFYSRFTYSGHCVSESSLLLKSPCRVLTYSYYISNQLIPTDRKGTFRMKRRAMNLQFDENLNTLTAPQVPRSDGHSEWVDSRIFWWNDLFFHDLSTGDPFFIQLGTRYVRWYYRSLHLNTRVIKSLTQRRDEESCKPLLSMPLVCKAFDSSRVLLNEKYVIYFMTYSLEVMCFGDNPRDVNENDSFFRGSEKDINLIKDSVE